jgi:SNF2 family DNA or RNA helicase
VYFTNWCSYYCSQDAPEEPVVSICAHVFCRQCISEQMANGDDTTCRFPKCKRALNSSLLFTLAALKNPGVDGGSAGVVDGESHGSVEVEPVWDTSSKIDAVIGTLQALPKISVLVEDGKIVKGPKAEKFLKLEASETDEGDAVSAIIPVASESAFVPVASESAMVSVASMEKVNSTEKAIVFSQWTSMLDLLETPLKQAGFCYRRLDGTMSVVARDRAVSDFNTLPEVRSYIILVGVVVSVF